MESLFEVGKCYFIRTVTNYFTGRVVKTVPGGLLLEEAAWIGDTGRFADSLKSGVFNEIEPFPDQVIIGTGSIVDACEWKHELPKIQK